MSNFFFLLFELTLEVVSAWMKGSTSIAVGRLIRNCKSTKTISGRRRRLSRFGGSTRKANEESAAGTGFVFYTEDPLFFILLLWPFVVVVVVIDGRAAGWRELVFAFSPGKSPTTVFDGPAVRELAGWLFHKLDAMMVVIVVRGECSVMWCEKTKRHREREGRNYFCFYFGKFIWNSIAISRPWSDWWTYQRHW